MHERQIRAVLGHGMPRHGLGGRCKRHVEAAVAGRNVDDPQTIVASGFQPGLVLRFAVEADRLRHIEPQQPYHEQFAYSAVEAANYMGIDFLAFKRLEDQGKVPGAWVDGEKRYRASDLLIANQRHGGGANDTVAGCSAVAFAVIFIVFGLGLFGLGPISFIFFIPFAFKSTSAAW